MTALRDELLKSGFEKDRITLMTDDALKPEHRPRKVNIEKQLELMLGSSKPDDLVLVASSGHGTFFDHVCYGCPPEGQRRRPGKKPRSPSTTHTVN